jgi:hypothetical protein
VRRAGIVERERARGEMEGMVQRAKALLLR